MSYLFKWFTLAGHQDIFFVYGTTRIHGTKYYKCILFYDGEWLKINFGIQEVEDSKRTSQPWAKATHELLIKIFSWKWDEE